MNYIKYLVIKRLKKIEKLNVDFNGNINIIVGKNESGKSTVIDAINIVMNQQYRNSDKSIIKCK